MKKQWMMALFLLIVFSGCRKELCYNHDEHSMSVKTHVQSDWEQEWEREYLIDWKEMWQEEWSREYDELRPEPGEGIRAVMYSEDGYQESNLPAEGGRLPITEGQYSFLFYNNDTEYIVFDAVSSHATAAATTRTRTRSNFAELHEGERTVTAPDMLYGAYVEEYHAERTWDPVVLPIQMRPLTYSYLIYYRFASGLQYVAQARGALAGMADKVYLKDGHTDGESSTILFDCEVNEQECMALVQSFGAPDYSYMEGYTTDQTNKQYTLSLEVMLRNGKQLTYTFDVSRMMQAQPRGGVLQVTDIVVSDEDGTEGSGAFDPDVEGWKDEIDIPLPIN